MIELIRRILSKIVLLIVLFSLSLAQLSDSYAQSAPDSIGTGTSWLLAARYGMGIWALNAPPDQLVGEFTEDEYRKTYIRDTFEATKTLQVLDVPVSAYELTLDWVEFTNFSSIGLFSQKVQILSKVNRTFLQATATLLESRNQDGAFGGAKGYPASNSLDTALALQALKAASYSDTTVLYQAINFLTTNQNSDGGWGFYPSTGSGQALTDPSNTYVTSIVLRTLSQYSSIFQIQPSLTKASTFLLEKQALNNDGGFGSSPSTVYETALSLIALVESGQGSGQDLILPLQKAINYLTSAQSTTNGSWNNDPYSTALALQALAKVKPNLAIASSDILFSQTTPTAGQSVTITATVHNTGLAAADNVIVQIFDGNPNTGGVQIGSNIAFTSIALGSSDSVQVVYMMTDNTDRHAIYVTAALANSSTQELNNTDNIAVNYFTVFSPSDLSVDSTATTYSPINPTVDLPLTLSFIVRNIGEKEAVNIPMQLYRGEPDNGGVLINTYTIPFLQGQGSYTLTATINNPVQGLNHFYLIVDQANTIPELDKTNNQGMITIAVAGHRPTDLVINASALSFVFPSGTNPGAGCSLYALITNAGTADVQTVVAFYKGDPATGGTLISTSTATVPALGSQSAAVNWTVPQDTPLIFVVVDPDNIVSETDKTNNKASKPLNGENMLPDLSIDPADISYHPACITPQSQFTVNATFHNWGGSSDPRGFSLISAALYDGAPENGGVIKGGFQFLLTVSPTGGGTSSTSIGPMTSMSGFTTLGNLTAGTHDFYVVADQFNNVQEITETNNRALLRINVTNDCEKDLIITDKDITFTPALPAAGSQVTINAKVYNTGSKYEGFYVAFYNGNPLNGGSLIRKVYTYINQETLQTVSTTFTMTTGVPNIYVVVDDNNQIVETDENNNTASRTIDTYRNDISISSGDIALSPVAPAKADLVTVNVLVHGSGTTDMTGIISLYEGTPEQGALIGSQSIVTHATQTVSVAFPSYSYPGDGVTLTAVIANVSPAEYDANNNRASATFGEHIEEGATNEGTDFWLAWPTAVYDTANIVIQSKYEAQVSVTLPVTPFNSRTTWQTTSITVSPGVPALIPLTNRIYGEVDKYSSVIEDKGIHITSDKDVSVLFHTPAYSSVADDTYLALPTNILGTRYFILSYSGVTKVSYTIVAVEDATNVDVGGTMIKLNKGQTYVYHLMAHISTDSTDLSGAYIQSDKPIGVIAATYCSFIPADPQVYYCNSLMEQMLPLSLLGTDYYTAPLYSPNSPDVYRLLALKDNTTVTIKDQYRTSTLSLNAGQWNEFEQETAQHITSNNPVMVAQYAKGLRAAHVGDPFQMTIIPTDKLKTDYRFYSYPGYGGFNLEYPEYTDQGSFVTIIAPEPVTTVTLDGLPIAGNWQPFPDKGNYIMVHVDSGEHVVNADKPVAVYSHGYGYCTAYGYPAGLSVPLGNIKLGNIGVSPSVLTEGQLAAITAVLSNEGNKAARDVVVRAYNGDPANGGVQLGPESYFAVVGPKEEKTVTVAWDSYGYAGTNKIYLVADPDNLIKEFNEADNTVMLSTDVTAPLKPDLAIMQSDVTLSKYTATEGELVTMGIKIKNRGSETGGITANLYLGDPHNGGRLLGSSAINQALPFYGETSLSFTINTVGFPGTAELFVVVDPDNVIDELIETNNAGGKQLTINQKRLVLSASTDKTQYQAQSDVGIVLGIKNENTSAWTGTGEVVIENMIGQQIAHVATFNLVDIKPLGVEGWRYKIPVTVTESLDLSNAVALVDVDFGGVFITLGISGKAVDKNSIRVVEFDSVGSNTSEKQAKAIFTSDALAKITWFMDGLLGKNRPRYFAIYFDTADNGPKALSNKSAVPVSGKLMAYSDNRGNVNILELKSNGTFSAPRLIDDVSPSNGDYTQGIVLDDFNNDGFVDIITGSAATGGIYYYQNKADGANTFLSKTTISTVTPGGLLHDIVSTDFNSDGNRDFIVSISSSPLSLYLGNGNGTFTQTELVARDNYVSFTSKVTADVDNDGYMDLLVGDSYGKIHLYKGNGDGTFIFPQEAAAIGNLVNGLTAGDFDGDGAIDLIANRRYNGETYYLHGNGDGTFGVPTAITAFGVSVIKTLAAADVNGDGYLDVIVNQTNSLLFYPGNGNGTFGTGISLAAGFYDSYGLSAYLGSTAVMPSLGNPEAVTSQAFPFTWNTGNTFAGDYLVRVTLSEGVGLVAESAAPFHLLPDMRVESRVTTDKIAYNPHETVSLAATALSLSSNAVLENLSAVVTVKNDQGTVLQTDAKAMPMLMPSAPFTFKSYWNTGVYSAGVYPVLLEVKDSAGALISTGTATVTITNVVTPKAALRGQVSVDKQSLMAGEPVNVSYFVTNVGNADIPAVTFSVQTVHVLNQSVYDNLSSQATLTMNGTFTGSGTFDTAVYSAKDYLVVLRANIGGVEETLAGTYFRVEGAPTVPALIAPASGSDVETFTPVLTVSNASDPNDDKLTYEFELYSDAGLSQLLASSDLLSAGTGTTAWTAPFDLMENATYYWRTRAYDGKLYGLWMEAASFRVNTINDPPTAPIPTSPAEGLSVSTVTPILTVNNASDPDSSGLTYNFQVALDSDFTQLVDSTIGALSGQGITSWQVTTGLAENTWYFWRAQADDWLITGPWSAAASFFVNTANEAPSMPAILAPANNSSVASLGVDIVLANSIDPDSAVISYFVELDRVPTFDSAGVIRSGLVAQGQDTTTWHAAGLQDNTLYFVRAKASDGEADSAWAAAIGFLVNTANDGPTAPTLENPSNGAGVNVFTPLLSVHNATDLDRDPLTYEFEVYADAGLVSRVAYTAGVIETAGITSWTVANPLTENQAYWWRARAFDGQANGPWMQTGSFTVNTANDAPGAPTLSSPLDGATIATFTPALSITNATDPDSDVLTYDFEVLSAGVLVAARSGVSQESGVTSWTVTPALNDNTAYQWRARAYDGDRYGAWTAMATFTVHVQQVGINVEIEVEPETLNQKSKGNWVMVEIELPHGYHASDVDIASIRLEGVVPAETRPYDRHDRYREHGCEHDDGEHDHDELKVKFDRNSVIAVLPNGSHVPVHVTGRIGSATFEGMDFIKVIH